MFQFRSPDGICYAGPAEYTEEGWNKTWFFPNPASRQVVGDRKHGIFATSWRTTKDGQFPLMWSPQVEYVNAVEVTESYRVPTDLQAVF